MGFRGSRTHTGRVPWVPELFSAPALERLLAKRRLTELVAVPYFDGLMTGEYDALLESFAGEPVLHDPMRGRITGERAFAAYVAEMSGWIARHDVVVEDVSHVVLTQCGFEEVVLHLDGDHGPVDLPVAIIGGRRTDGRIEELRIYYSTWQLTGHHRIRPPLLQPDPELHPSGVVAEYQNALAAGDVDAVVATFEPDGYTREPAGAPYIHKGHDGLRAFYGRYFSNGGGIPLEHCTLVDDGATCALEYNVVRWGRTTLPPQAGVAVYTRGPSGRLASARIYDDADPPLS
jgi:SnoaL-like domain